MRKYKMMALTGILLSSTILGANTSVVQAASSDKTSTSTSQPSAIKVINDLGDLLTTSTNTVNAQTQFSDIESGTTLKAAPIFGDQSESSFDKTLQSELNVVNSSNQLVPMTVVSRDSTTGFVKEVSYTLDGTTKTVNVDYDYALPTVSLEGNQYMNFGSDAAQKDVDAATSTSSVKAATTNGADANGHANSASVTANTDSIDLSKASTEVKFTPKDNYIGGIPATRTVNVYQKLTVDELKAGFPKTVQSEDSLDQTRVIYNANNKQRYAVTPTNINTDGNTITYDVTEKAIQNDGSEVKTPSGDPIIFEEKNLTATINDDANTYDYTLVFHDVRTGEPVVTVDGSVKSDAATLDSDAVKDALAEKDSTGYTLFSKNPAAFTVTASSNTKEYTVHKKATEKVNYVDTTTGKIFDTEDVTGYNGATVLLNKIPANYQLDDSKDLLQTINADQPNKDIYVTPTKSAVKNLDYTVTFRNKTNGDVVGTAVNGTGNLGDYIGLTAPTGYSFATIFDSGFLLLKNGQNVTKYVTEDNTPYNISYVDQDTNKEVGTQTGKGANGSDVTLTAPDGYTFVNANDVTYTINSNTAKSTIYVKKSDTTTDNIVATYPDKGRYVKIYDADGNLNDSVVLSAGTSWIIDQTREINGEEYYRVATNEYIKASDAYKYVPLQQVVTTKSGNVKPVYNSKGQLVLDLALDYNTPWYTDRSATINGEKMYRVATDKWVRSADVNEG